MTDHVRPPYSDESREAGFAPSTPIETGADGCDSTAPLAFRSAGVQDIPRLRELYAQLIPEATPARVNMEADLLSMTAFTESGELIVGHLEEEVIATCQVVFYRNLVRSPYKKALIDSVVVDSRYRNCGFGTDLLRWTARLAAENGCSIVQVVAGFERLAGQAVYKKTGFTRYGVGLICRLPPKEPL